MKGNLFIVIGVLLAGGFVTAIAQDSREVLSPGVYAGEAVDRGMKFKFTVMIDQIDGNKITGWAEFYTGYSACRARAALSGTIREQGEVQITAPGPIADCGRIFDLKFTGPNQLTGTLKGLTATFPATLTKK